MGNWDQHLSCIKEEKPGKEVVSNQATSQHLTAPSDSSPQDAAGRKLLVKVSPQPCPSLRTKKAPSAQLCCLKELPAKVKG